MYRRLRRAGVRGVTSKALRVRGRGRVGFTSASRRSASDDAHGLRLARIATAFRSARASSRARCAQAFCWRAKPARMGRPAATRPQSKPRRTPYRRGASLALPPPVPTKVGDNARRTGTAPALPLPCVHGALVRGPPSVGCAASVRGPRQSPAGGRARAGRPAGVGLGSSQSQARTVGLQSTSYVSSFRYSMSSRPSQRNVMRARHRPARSETHSRVARRDVPLSDGTGLHSPSNRCIAPNVTRPPRPPRARGTPTRTVRGGYG